MHMILLSLLTCLYLQKMSVNSSLLCHHLHFSAFINLALGQHLVTHDAVVSIHVFVTMAMGAISVCDSF